MCVVPAELGAIGDFGAFSVHEVKNIASLGEGSVLVTNDPLGEDFAKARFCGFDLQTTPPPTWLYNISPIRTRKGTAVAGNFSSTEIQAVALLNQMCKNDQIIEEHRAAAQKLYDTFAGVKGLIPGPMGGSDIGATFHLFLLQADPTVIKGGIQTFKATLSKKGVT